MRTTATVRLLAWLFLALAGLPSTAAPDEPVAAVFDGPVTVDLKSGRQMTAQVDLRTDEALLWLRWSRGSARLLRPIQWDRVRRVQIGDETVTADQLRRRVEAARPEATPAPRDRQAIRIVLKGHRTPQPRVALDSGRPEAKVRSLAIDARVANWDADVEVDGLVLDVYPLDASGQPVPVDGTLEVELIVQRQDATGSASSFPRRGRWTQRVRPADFASGAARYRLAFSAVRFRPESDLSAAPYGAVHATLNVSGQGVYSATASMVRVRPYSVVRDALQGVTGRRFFPQERTGRGQR